ncbi:MAG: phosphoglycolate phosphatase, partial [Betaproteobacteria bacterium]|nr:phosphoglycolate phosphatase [Betaproteobacteria bacterium]
MVVKLRAVWFDLDGTLVDSAVDLAAPIHAMRMERGLAPIDAELLR